MGEKKDIMYNIYVDKIMYSVSVALLKGWTCVLGVH